MDMFAVACCGQDARTDRRPSVPRHRRHIVLDERHVLAEELASVRSDSAAAKSGERGECQLEH